MNRHISTSTGLVILVLILFAAGVAIWAAIPRDQAMLADKEATQQQPTEKTETDGSSAQQQPNVYRSEYFGFQITLPDGWEAWDQSGGGIELWSPNSVAARNKFLTETEVATEGPGPEVFIITSNEGLNVGEDSPRTTKIIGDLQFDVYMGGVVRGAYVYEISNEGIIYYFITSTPDLTETILASLQFI